jgi:GTP cyclohydrolase FolE2
VNCPWTGATAGAAQPAQHPGRSGAAHDLPVMMRCACACVHVVKHHSQDRQQAADACAIACRLKETSPLSYFSGTLDIGKQMKIGVKVNSRHGRPFRMHVRAESACSCPCARTLCNGTLTQTSSDRLHCSPRNSC